MCLTLSETLLPPLSETTLARLTTNCSYPLYLYPYLVLYKYPPAYRFTEHTAPVPRIRPHSMNVNSPTPGTMPPPNLKRPRQSAAGTGPSTASTSRVKRRKGELDDGAGEGSEAGGRGRGGSGIGGKGKDEEGGESSEGQIKVCRVSRL